MIGSLSLKYFLGPDEKGMPRDCPEIIYMYLSNMPFWGNQCAPVCIVFLGGTPIVSEGALHLGQDSVYIPPIRAW